VRLVKSERRSWGLTTLDVPRLSTLTMNSRRFSILRLLLLTVWLSLGARAATVIWVAPHGSDEADGSQERPLATLKAAQIKLRTLVAQGLKDEATVRLRGGEYSMAETLELTPDDLGDGSFRITFQPHQGERVTLSGARRLPSGWTALGDNLWVLSLAEAKGGAWVFRSLFRAGASLPRAREPDSGHWTVAQVTDERRRLVLHERLPAAWSALGGVELNSIAHWHFNRQRVATIAPESITALRGIGTDVSSSRITEKSHSRVWLENAREFADSPGEWFLDSSEGNLYYRAASGEDPNLHEFRAPVLRELIVVRGSPERLARNVRFRDLEWAETDWEMPAEDRLGIQAGAWASDRSRTFSPGAALRFIYAHDTVVERCRFRDLGDGAIAYEIGAARGLVSDCDFVRVGSNSVQIGRMAEYTGEGHPLHRDFTSMRERVDQTGKLPGSLEMWTIRNAQAPEAPAQITVADRKFIDCGQIDFGSVAVCVTYAHHVTIEHNLFRRLPYSAVSVGWRWAPGLTHCHSNLIRRNRIEEIMLQAGDGGGIYLVGEQPGTRVLENFIHDSGRNYWAHGIYPDECSDHMEIAGNYITGVLDRSIFMNKNGPNQQLHDNNGEPGPTRVMGPIANGTRWVQFSPERTPPDLSLYGPRMSPNP